MRPATFFCILTVMMAVASGCIAGTGNPSLSRGLPDTAPTGSFVMSGGTSIAISVKADEITTPYPEAKEWFLKGLTASTQYARYNESLEYFDNALTIDPGFAEAWYAKGVALHNLKRYDEAILCYDRALAIDPSNTFVMDLKAMAQKDKSRLAEAPACSRGTAGLDPGCGNTPGVAPAPGQTQQCHGQSFPVPAGGDVYIGESCLNVSGAVSSGQVISWYNNTWGPGNDTPYATRIVLDAQNFFVNPADFVGFEGTWYTGNKDRIAFVVKVPTLHNLCMSQTRDAGAVDRADGCRVNPGVVATSASPDYTHAPPITESQKASALRIVSGSRSEG
ncbi:MAG: DUF3821 domain-containing protein, partial [Methanoregula sp.]